MRDQSKIHCVPATAAGSLLVLLGTVFLQACGADASAESTNPGPSETAGESASLVPANDPDHALITETLAKVGLAGEPVEIEGNIIRVNGDIILYRDVMMAGGYGPAEDAGELDGALVEKGYRAAALVSQANVANIDIVFATGPTPGNGCNSGVQCAMPTAISQGFGLAALWDWSGKVWPTFHQTKINIAETNTGPKITIRAFHAGGWPNGTPCAAIHTACADFPSNNKPGANIWVRNDMNPFDNPNQCDWNSNWALLIGNHELGHTLGVTHPKASGSTRVTGTASCSGTAAQCILAGNAGYDTVMTNYALTAYPDCQPTEGTSLSADDLLVANKLYPP